MKPVITIMPDWGGAYAWRKSEHTDAPGVGGNTDFAGGWCNETQIPDDLHQAFTEWQARFEVLRIKDFESFDWPAFHKEGIRLCHRLKQLLGDSAIVLYEKVYEDPHRHDAERREILGDGSVIFCRIRR